MQERAARERDQAEPVAFEAFGQVGDGELRAREAIGHHVAGEHALRDVDRDQDVDAAPSRLLPLDARQRPGEGGAEEADRAEQQSALGQPPLRRKARRQFGYETRRDEARQVGGTPCVRPAQQGHEQSHQDGAREQPGGLPEAHGSPRRVLAARRASRQSSDKAPRIAHGKSSRYSSKCFIVSVVFSSWSISS